MTREHQHRHFGGRAGGARIYVSLAAFRHKQLIQLLVDNVLHFAHPWRLALHTSAGSASAESMTFVQPGVVLHNPQHIRVTSNHGPLVFAVHLSNFELLDALPDDERPTGTDRILLLSGNSVLFRACAGLLEQTPLSFGSTSFSDVLRSQWAASQSWIPLAVGSAPWATNRNTLGLKWTNVGAVAPTGGRELTNAKLSFALKRRTDFKAEDLATFDLDQLQPTNYIKSGGSYFQPAWSKRLQKPSIKLEGTQRRLPPKLRDCRNVPDVDPWAEPSNHPHVGPMRWTTRLEPPPSAGWDDYLEQLLHGDDSPQFAVVACTRNHWHRGFFNWTSHGAATELSGFLRALPVTVSTHEGAVYPAALAAALLRAVEGTELSVANLTTRGCPHESYCNLEETVLPTVAWQHFPRLLSQLKPPLVARVLEGVNFCRKDARNHSSSPRAAAAADTVDDSSSSFTTVSSFCNSSDDSLTSLLAFVGQFHKQAAHRTWCGVKLASDGPSEEGTQALLQAIHDLHISAPSARNASEDTMEEEPHSQPSSPRRQRAGRRGSLTTYTNSTERVVRCWSQCAHRALLKVEP